MYISVWLIVCINGDTFYSGKGLFPFVPVYQLFTICMCLASPIFYKKKKKCRDSLYRS